MWFEVLQFVVWAGSALYANGGVSFEATREQCVFIGVVLLISAIAIYIVSWGVKWVIANKGNIAVQLLQGLLAILAVMIIVGMCQETDHCRVAFDSMRYVFDGRFVSDLMTGARTTVSYAHSQLNADEFQEPSAPIPKESPDTGICEH